MGSMIKYLTCACCGESTKGRQYWNRDTGFGLCDSCADYIEEKEGKEYLVQNYGKDGIHIRVKGAR